MTKSHPYQPKSLVAVSPEGFLVTAKFANRVTDLEQKVRELESKTRSEVSALWNRINVLEKVIDRKVKSLQSQLRVQQALMVDVRLAVKGLLKE